MDGNALEIDDESMNSDITTQKMLADATKRSQEIAETRPQPFNGVGMDFANTVAIIIACPLIFAMTNRRTGALDSIIAIVFIGLNVCAFARKLFDMFAQSNLFGIRCHAQADLSVLPT